MAATLATVVSVLRREPEALSGLKRHVWQQAEARRTRRRARSVTAAADGSQRASTGSGRKGIAELQPEAVALAKRLHRRSNAD